MAQLSRELLGLAGEYAVASELCVRGLYAQLTLGPHKRTDILIESESALLRVQVKAKQGAEWPSVSGISTQDEMLVLVDFQGDRIQRPDFYILCVDDWRELVEAEEARVPDATVDEKLRIQFPDGWRGLNLSPSHVDAYRDCWDKVLRATA